MPIIIVRPVSPYSSQETDNGLLSPLVCDHVVSLPTSVCLKAKQVGLLVTMMVAVGPWSAAGLAGGGTAAHDDTEEQGTSRTRQAPGVRQISVSSSFYWTTVPNGLILTSLFGSPKCGGGCRGGSEDLERVLRLCAIDDWEAQVPHSRIFILRDG